MLSFAQNGYTDAEVRTALLAATRFWTFRYELLDSQNRKIADLDTVASGSVAYNFLADVKGTAKFLMADNANVDWLADRIRPFARLTMPPVGVDPEAWADEWADSWTAQPDRSTAWVEWPCGVYLLSTPRRVTTEAGRVMREVEGYDQGLVLRDDKLASRLTITAGTLYTDAIADLLSDLPDVSITSSTATLPTDREWPPGTMKSEVVADLLSSINYDALHFDAWGRAIAQPYTSPTDRDPSWVYADDDESVMLPEVAEELDLFDVPNEWVLVLSDPDRPPLSSVYTNSSSDSPTSTKNRGRTITDYREEQNAADQDALDAKAERLAFQASQVYEAIEFDTGLMPFHEHAEVYRIEFSGLDVSATYSEHRYEYELRHGATMTHRARRVVSV